MRSLQQIFTGSVPLAIAAAITWGGGDFSGGMAVKRSQGTLRNALRVVLLVHSVSFAALLLAAEMHGDRPPTGAPLLWSIVAGLCAGTCVIAFYVCLSRGAMGAAAAVTGLLTAAIPAVVAGFLEGSPGLIPLLGFATAGAAIWLIADSPQQDAAASGTMPLAVISGLGFGLYFVALRQASPAGLLWPLAVTRTVSVALCVLGLAVLAFSRSPVAAQSTGQHGWLPKQSVIWALAAAVLDTGGNLFYLAAVRHGRLDIAAVLASLYPATTILLAAWLLRERPTRRQAVGMALAVASVVLITL